MAKNFVLHDSEGNELWAAPEDVRVLAVSMRTEKGEAGRIGVEDTSVLTLVFETTGRLNPNIIDVREAQAEARREFAKGNSPEPITDEEENAKREGRENSADFILTSDTETFNTPKDFKDSLVREASPSEPGPSTRGTDQENADPSGSDTEDKKNTQTKEPSTPHAGMARDHGGLDLNKEK